MIHDPAFGEPIRSGEQIQATPVMRCSKNRPGLHRKFVLKTLHLAITHSLVSNRFTVSDNYGHVVKFRDFDDFQRGGRHACERGKQPPCAGNFRGHFVRHSQNANPAAISQTIGDDATETKLVEGFSRSTMAAASLGERPCATSDSYISARFANLA